MTFERVSQQPFLSSATTPRGIGFTNSILPTLSQNSSLSHSNVYGPAQISENSTAVFGNIYETHYHVYPSAVTTATCLGVHSHHTKRVLLRPWKLPFLFRFECDIVVRSSSHAREKSYYIQISLLRKWVFQFGFCLEASGDLRIFRPRLRFLTPDNNPLILACIKGDLSGVRQLLCERTINANDVTQRNETALYHAINNNHEVIVRELLLNGADANQCFDERQSSPLAWALRQRNDGIARLLIQHGADLDFISRVGWSLLQYLWIDEHTPQPSCMAFLKLLQNADSDITNFTTSNNVDAYGWSLLSRVACTGTPDGVSFMLRQGAPVHWKNIYDWNALFEAVYGSKLDNVRVLLPHFPDFRSMRDVRGWTLLHVAAEESNEEAVRFLLEQGMDWRVKSWPYSADVPESLIGVECTPMDVARTKSLKFEERCLDIVREVCDV